MTSVESTTVSIPLSSQIEEEVYLKNIFLGFQQLLDLDVNSMVLPCIEHHEIVKFTDLQITSFKKEKIHQTYRKALNEENAEALVEDFIEFIDFNVVCLTNLLHDPSRESISISIFLTKEVVKSINQLFEKTEITGNIKETPLWQALGGWNYRVWNSQEFVENQVHKIRDLADRVKHLIKETIFPLQQFLKQPLASGEAEPSDSVTVETHSLEEIYQQFEQYADSIIRTAIDAPVRLEDPNVNKFLGRSEFQDHANEFLDSLIAIKNIDYLEEILRGFSPHLVEDFSADDLISLLVAVFSSNPEKCPWLGFTLQKLLYHIPEDVSGQSEYLLNSLCAAFTATTQYQFSLK